VPINSTEVQRKYSEYLKRGEITPTGSRDRLIGVRSNSPPGPPATILSLGIKETIVSRITRECTDAVVPTLEIGYIGGVGV
jgi:hypothetical protein